MKFGRKPNHFLQKLKEDAKKIKLGDMPLIKGDKSTNYYKMESKKYDQLLVAEIQKEYKKVTPLQAKKHVKWTEKEYP